MPRTTLIDVLEGSAVPIAVLSAGPGWGKTTLLAQWASRSQRPFAWVSVDERDNDPIVLLTYVAAALNRVSPLDPGVFDALATPGVSVEGTALPRLAANLGRVDEPIVLVLDDLHLIDNPTCFDAIEALAMQVPEASQIALSNVTRRRSRSECCGHEASRWRSARTSFAWTKERLASSYVRPGQISPILRSRC